jgi:hypothetical protein
MKGPGAKPGGAFRDRELPNPAGAARIGSICEYAGSGDAIDTFDIELLFRLRRRSWVRVGLSNSSPEAFGCV